MSGKLTGGTMADITGNTSDNRENTSGIAENTSDSTIRIWDPLVRIGHWVLVAGFATAYLTEGKPEWLHTWAGYAIAITVALRIVWGFVGPRRARFSDFVTGPRRAIAYLRALPSGRAQRHLGHSPAGGIMTLALLAALALTAFSGMATLAAKEGEGPLASIIAVVPHAPQALLTGDRHDDEDEDREGGDTVWKELHEFGANLTLALIFLHLGGVVLASVAHRENLVAAMVTGRKRAT